MQYTKKTTTLLNPCELLMKIQSTENALKCAYFCVKNFINQRNGMDVCGAAPIFSGSRCLILK